MPKLGRNFDYVLAIAFLACLLLPNYLITRSETFPLLSAYGLAFVTYLLLCRSDQSKFLLSTGVIARIGLFFVLPILSDDVYRFLWDGMLLKNGIHPFAELPRHYLGKRIPGLNEELFQLLNSPKYFTVYPPLNQGIFWLSVTISESWLTSVGVIRLFLFVADLGTFHFLKKILISKGKNPDLAFLYFLNPLVIWEGIGNLHFEVMVIFFLTYAIYHYQYSKFKSGAGLAMAIGTKLLPLIYVPFFFFRDIKMRNWKFTVSVAIFTTLSLLPLFNASFINGMQNSLVLYVRNFEFNSSLFLLAREISVLTTGYNQIATIGPAFAMVSLLVIIGLSIHASRRKWTLDKTMLSVLSIYLLLALTIHPWYILPLIVFGLLSGYIFPIIWSFMIFLTYAGYSEEGYSLHWGWVTLEYLVVFLAFIYNQRIKTWLTIS